MNRLIFPGFNASCVDGMMSDLVEPETLAASEHARLELFMTVVRVTDWSTIVPWYIDTLGMVPVLIDAEREFALLAAGDGRLGFKGIKSDCTLHERTKVRFVFQVADVDSERQRLAARGVIVSTPFDNREEGFREVRLHDPEGNSLTMFAWSDPARDGRFSRGRA
jgi:predicted enzyme related to lactoylglutathione lyase